MRFAVPSLLGLLVVGSSCTGPADASAVDESEVRSAKASVVSAMRLPLAEVSGLGRRLVGGAPQYLAIGDSSSALVTFAVDADGAVSQVATRDVSSLVGRKVSQWEAVAGDAEGRVFVLSEAAATIEVLDAKLERLLHVIRLEGVASAEGMVLLANGHLLVVNEKDPTVLHEVAPKGEAPEGYRAALALGDGAFRLPEGAESTFVVVKSWTYKTSDAKSLADVSDLAVDAEGRLALLGDQARVVVRVERELAVDEDSLDVRALHALPSAVAKPEGLVFVGDRALVASDVPEASDESLFTVAF